MHWQMKGLVFLVALGFLWGCVNTASPPGTTSATVSQESISRLTPPNLTVLDPELRSIYEAALRSPLPLTSTEKIDTAFAQQQISSEEFTVLSLQALFDSNSLPSEYKGDDFFPVDATDELMLARENWGSLSESAKAKIKDWVFLSEAEVQAELRNVNLKSTDETEQALVAHFAEPDFELVTLEAIPGKAVVKAFLPANVSVQQRSDTLAKMEWIKQGLVDSWPKFTGLLGLEPSQKVFVYLHKLGKNTYGEATITTEPSFDPIERCRLKVDTAQTGDEETTKSFTAHELFHCFQFYIPLRNWGNADQRWLKEATATWSMHWVYPSSNKEHEYLPLFFSSRHKPFVLEGGVKEYADYPFFLFLQQSEDEKAVANVLLSATGVPVKTVLEAIPAFDEQFAKFSAWNWNKEPEKKYSDSPDFSTASISGEAVSFLQLMDQEEKQSFAISLKQGSALYATFEVPQDSLVEKILFKFKEKNDAKHQRTALVKINNEWREENWSNLEEKRFCLDRPNERVQGIVLIFSNSDLFDPFASEYELDTKGECPKEITGRTVFTTLAAEGDAHITAEMISNDVLQYDESTDEYKLKSRSMTCNMTTAGSIQAISWGQPVGIFGATTGSGSLTENYDDLSTAPVRIAFDRPGNVLYFDVDPEKQNPNWVRYEINERMVAGSISGEGNATEMGDCGANMVFPSQELNLREVLQNNHLFYEKTITSPDGIATVRLLIDYTLAENENQ